MKKRYKKNNALELAENLDGSGRTKIWMELEETGAGMDMGAVKRTLSTNDGKKKVAELLENYADNLETLLMILKSVL